SGTIDLPKQVEDATKHLMRNADAGIANGYDAVSALARGADPNFTARVGVLRGVAQEVTEHLRQTHTIGFKRQWLRRQRDVQSMPKRFDLRAACLDGVFEHGSQVERFFP